MSRLGAIRDRFHRRTEPSDSVPMHAWFDAPDAADQLASRAETLEHVRILQSWVNNGYAIVESLVPRSAIDAMLADLDGVFDGVSGMAQQSDALADVEIHGLQFDDGRPATTRYAELSVLPIAERIAMRERSNWRVHGLFHASPAADEIRRLPEMARIASMILGVPSEATYSINFHYGSIQELHQDSAVFHLGVPNMICGAWIACEDIAAESGPLVYYPGSHRRPAFDGFPWLPAREPPHRLRGHRSCLPAAHRH